MYKNLTNIILPRMMLFSLFFRVCIVLLLFLSSSFVSARIYTALDGRTLEAEIISIEEDTVRFRRVFDSKYFLLKLEKLSAKDRNFILNEQASGRLTASGYSSLRVPPVAAVQKNPLHFQASRKIDVILSKYWASNRVQAEPLIDDATYLRRAYLKIIGRIPSYAEAVHFLNDSSPQKRSRLVDRLLDSPGYVSHNFNLWADVLRVKTTGLEGGRQGGVYYAPWLKDQLRQNVAYDDFVASLITAQGYPWENPAVGYYLRDLGMPLDNMAMTAQIFLGTQMQCAQCHNHPTDKWTQQDFYQLSAFTAGIDTRVDLRAPSSPLKPILSDLQQMVRRQDAYKTEGLAWSSLVDAAKSFFKPMSYVVAYRERELKIPHDYEYDDVAPNSVVEPDVIFGEWVQPELHNSAARVESYADWMVSKNNQRFTQVIANRMWKHVMGKGLIEPIDNLTEDSVADSPELLLFLESLMQSVDYDLKQYLRVLYNTEYFQRAAVIDHPDLDDDYQLQGPTFQRMSSEQFWDSIATLMTPEIDQIYNQGYTTKNQSIVYNSNRPPAVATFIAEKTTQELSDHLNHLARTKHKLKELQKAAGSEGEAAIASKSSFNALKLSKQQSDAARREYQRLLSPVVAEVEQVEQPIGMNMMLASSDRKKSRSETEWLQNIRRASELESPQADGHLLEVFGQSDRMLIENADAGSNILQALFLMNSSQTNMLLANESAPVLEAHLALTAEDKIETLYIGFLARKPTQAEQDALLDYFKQDPEQARQRIIWAMLNTQQFLFIQ
jgi:hypothetical protein